jgi:hypothetical protein
VASDVIARTVQAGSKLGAGRGVSGVDRHGQQTFAARDVGGAGAPRTTRGTYREWAEWVGGTPRGSLTSPEEKRTSPYRKSRLNPFFGIHAFRPSRMSAQMTMPTLRDS